MAIGTDAAIEFYGTEDEVTVATPGTVNDGAFSVTGDTSDWTNDDDAPYARFKFKVLAASLSGAPTAGAFVAVYAQHMNIDGTDDTPTPDSNYPHTFLCSIPLDLADADQIHVSSLVALPNLTTSQVYHFWIENQSGVNFTTGADYWELWVTPITYGPHA